jgi:hypothetical protein
LILRLEIMETRTDEVFIALSGACYLEGREVKSNPGRDCIKN